MSKGDRICKKWKDISPVMYVLAVLFTLKIHIPLIYQNPPTPSGDFLSNFDLSGTRGDALGELFGKSSPNPSKPSIIFGLV